jgi:hypothetical protein
MPKRTPIVVAMFVTLLAIIFWDQQRIRALKRDLNSLENPMSAPPGRMTPPEEKAPSAVASEDRPEESTPTNARAPVLRVGEETIDSSLEKWLERVARLKNWLDQKPELKIPELSLAINEDWLFATYHNKTESDEDLQRAYDFVVTGVQTRINSAILAATHDCEAANGAAPTEMRQILPYLSSSVGDFVLRHYDISAAPKGIVLRRRAAAK